MSEVAQEALVSRLNWAKVRFMSRFGFEPSIVLMRPATLEQLFEEISLRWLHGPGDDVARLGTIMGMRIVTTDVAIADDLEREFAVGFVDKEV